MSQAKKMNANVKFYIELAVYLLITFGIGFLPPFGAITPFGMKILGVFIGTIFGWIVFEMVWPSLFALCALGWIGYTSIGEGFASGLSYYMIPMMFACYIVVGAVVDSKAALFIAQWIISRKITIGKPEVIVFLYISLQLSWAFVQPVLQVFSSFGVSYMPWLMQWDSIKRRLGYNM